MTATPKEQPNGDPSWMSQAGFVKERGYTNYSNPTLDFIIDCHKVPFKERVFALIVRQSWGWDSPFAVKWRDKSGNYEPFGQSDIVERLFPYGDRQKVCRACKELVKEGRLLPDKGRLLYPSGCPVALAETPPPENPAKLPNLATLATVQKVVLRFIPKFPVAKLAENGNFEHARLAVSRYNQRRDDAKAGYKTERKVAEDDLKKELCDLVQWQLEPPHPLITTKHLTASSTSSGVHVVPAPSSGSRDIKANPPTGGRVSSSEPVVSPSPPARPWWTRLRQILEALPIGTPLDEPMFERIAGNLTEELLDQFETQAKNAKNIRKWAGYEDIARQVAKRGLVRAASAAGSEQSDQERRYYQRVGRNNG